MAQQVPCQSDEQMLEQNERKSQHNSSKLECSTCGCVILSPTVGEYVQNKPFNLPLCRQKKNIKEVEKETLSEWWSVKKAYDFENIGFTHDASDGIKYLVCADCEVGPVGFLCPETNCHFIACKRVKSMQDGS